MSKETYDAGYNTGLTWDCDWVPGGPFIYTAGFTQDPVKRAERENKEIISRQDHVDWKRGWSDGVAERDRLKK